MRVLWFTHTSSLYGVAHGHYGGGWISSLERELQKRDDITLGVCFFLNDAEGKVEKDGTVYYPVRRAKKNAWYVLRQLCHSVEWGSKNHEATVMPSLLEVVDDFKPDIIHVFGSENVFGLVANYVKIPVVLHIQGILNPYLNAFLPPFVSWRTYLFSECSPKRMLQNLSEKMVWQRNCVTERRLIKAVRHYMGRTVWDERVTKVLNSGAIYYRCGEILRDVFYKEGVRELPTKRPVFVTAISSQLYKGYDVVLKTAKLLKYVGLDFEWRVYGWNAPRIAEKIVRGGSNALNIKLLGVATAEKLRDVLLHCTAYVQPSYIDNSPNSVCEAQMCGCTCIATNVGGVSALIEEGKTGFLVPANDPYQTAYLMMQLWREREMNLAIGQAARAVAVKRHDREEIASRVVEIYEEVLKEKEPFSCSMTE